MNRFEFTRRSPILQAMLIIAAAFWVFFPALRGDWLWDDGLLIRDNELVHNPDGLWMIWFQPHKLIDYLPITVSVEWIEWRLWGDKTFGYHLTNLILHVISGLLVWRLLAKFNLRLAWFGGLIFVIHPVVVESVAWIAELKNTLSLPFFLLALCAWIDYDRSGKRNDYLRALVCFLIAMLCKATMVMFPVILLLYAWSKRGRIAGNDLIMSLPFFAVSLAIGIITIKFLHPAMGLTSVVLDGPISRLALSGSILAFYFSKCVFPIGLLPIYPQWSIQPTPLLFFLPWLAVIGIAILCLRYRATWGRYVALGVGFFLINLVPFLGFTQGAYMSFTWVMDHLLYIPLIGLVGLAVAGCERVLQKLYGVSQIVGVVALTAIATLLALQSRSYAAVFVNQEQLWSYTLQGNPDSAVAHNNLGLVYLNSNRLSQAIEQFEAAIRLKPDYAYAHNGLGNTLFMTGHSEAAIAQYREAVRFDPKYPEAHNGLGNALLQTGNLDEAKAECEEALKLNPRYFEPYCTLGLILAKQGRTPEAIKQFETAELLRPNDPRIKQELDLLRGKLK